MWGSRLAFQDLDLLRDTYVSVATLRNSYGQLHHHLPPQTGSRGVCLPPDELTTACQALGVEADVVESMAGMPLIFRDGCLEVSEAWAERDDLMEALTGTLIYSWTLRKFSDSRWDTTGKPCRSLVLGLTTGIGTLHQEGVKVSLDWFLSPTCPPTSNRLSSPLAKSPPLQ